MSSITAWNRVEASTRAKELEPGLQARIADPTPKAWAKTFAPAATSPRRLNRHRTYHRAPSPVTTCFTGRLHAAASYLKVPLSISPTLCSISAGSHRPHGFEASLPTRAAYSITTCRSFVRVGASSKRSSRVLEPGCHASEKCRPEESHPS